MREPEAERAWEGCRGVYKSEIGDPTGCWGCDPRHRIGGDWGLVPLKSPSCTSAAPQSQNRGRRSRSWGSGGVWNIPLPTGTESTCLGSHTHSCWPPLLPHTQLTGSHPGEYLGPLGPEVVSSTLALRPLPPYISRSFSSAPPIFISLLDSVLYFSVL